MKGTKRSALRVIVCVFAVGMMLAATISTAAAAAVEVSVYSRRVYTDTGVTVRAGDVVTIKASGFIHFGEVPINHLSPAGIPIARCETLTASHRSKGPRPAPTLDCWSLIGRIGAGKPFAVGTAKAVQAPTGGKLFLGVNDNLLGDNSGAWIATVTVEKASTGTTIPSGKAISSGKKSSSSTMLVVIGGLIVVAALLGLVFFGRVRRSRAAAVEKAAPGRAPWPAPAPVRPTVSAQAPEPLPAAAPVAAAPVVSLLEAEQEAQSQSVTDSPTEGDFTDVNIFEVEFPDNTSLRVGYNYFPEGTVVRFRIAQRARAAATGSFLASGGGSRYHFVTVEIGQELEPDPDGSDVSFTWEVGGVPFQYSVRRVSAG